MNENLTNFSRPYEGIDGVAIGSATLYKYDNPDRATDSSLVDEDGTILDVDGEKLGDYVCQKYEGDAQ